jgi:hypothetical protein
MERNSGRWTVVVSIIGGSAKLLCLGSVLLAAACSTPTLPSDFPAFYLTNAPDKDAAEQDR